VFKEMQEGGGIAAGALDFLRDLISAPPDKIPDTADKIPDYPGYPGYSKTFWEEGKGVFKETHERGSWRGT
jgi:hypothetical protein